MSSLSEELTVLDKNTVFHPQTNPRTHMLTGPSLVDSTDGIYAYDLDGNEFLDSGAGLWCNSLGGKNERIAKAAFNALNRMPYVSLFRHQSHEAAIRLSSKLLEIAPSKFSKVMLQSSGSEANDTAVKLVWYYWNAKGQPQRRKIISRQGSYHGSTCVAISMTGNSQYHAGFGLPFEGFLHLSSPNFYKYGRKGESEEAYVDRLVAELEALIEKEGADTIAAFWADPVQGNAGAVAPPGGYFERIQKVLDQHGILFVSDEVICGFGRTGNMWGSQTFNMRPDILTCAKGLSAGMLPISAVMISERVFEPVAEQSDKFGAFVHGYTYGGHPVSSAVALEVLNIYEEIDIVGHVKKMERHFLAGMEKMKELPIVGDASGVGLIGGIELEHRNGEGFSPDFRISERIIEEGMKNGIILRAVGNRIALSPPLIISSEEIEIMFERIRSVILEIDNLSK
ncbi:MAG: aminotransferase [Rhizobiaceae bacterium]